MNLGTSLSVIPACFQNTLHSFTLHDLTVISLHPYFIPCKASQLRLQIKHACLSPLCSRIPAWVPTSNKPIAIPGIMHVHITMPWNQYIDVVYVDYIQSGWWIVKCNLCPWCMYVQDQMWWFFSQMRHGHKGNISCFSTSLKLHLSWLRLVKKTLAIYLCVAQIPNSTLSLIYFHMNCIPIENATNNCYKGKHRITAVYFYHSLRASFHHVDLYAPWIRPGSALDPPWIHPVVLTLIL